MKTAESLIQVPIKAVNFSSARTTKCFPLSRCASATKIVRPLESTAETQPQLQPALLRLDNRDRCVAGMRLRLKYGARYSSSEITFTQCDHAVISVALISFLMRFHSVGSGTVSQTQSVMQSDTQSSTAG